MSHSPPNQVQRPVTAARITDATTAGRDLLTAANAAAQRTLMSVYSTAEVDGLAANYATAAQGATADTAVQPARAISAGTGLSGGGDLSADRTLTLANTAVTAGSYTAADITVDAQGRITAAANGAGGGGLSGLGSVDNAIVRTNGTAGDAAQGSLLSVSDAGVLDRSDGTSQLTVGNATGGVSMPGGFRNGYGSGGLYAGNDHDVGLSFKNYFGNVTGGIQQNNNGSMVIWGGTSGSTAAVAAGGYVSFTGSAVATGMFDIALAGDTSIPALKLKSESGKERGFFVYNNNIYLTNARKDQVIIQEEIVQFQKPIKLVPYTVATLPAAASNDGCECRVIDSTVVAIGNYGATVAGGGGNKVKVFSDGTNWVIA